MKKFLGSLLMISFLTFYNIINAQGLQLGADHLGELLPKIKGKKVSLVVNQTSVLTTGTHLLDTLLACNVHVVKIFAPEHGFRGNADAGEQIINYKDSKTGLEVISLYGKNYKPSPLQLRDIDVLIFDMQDVGTRFYTYISTMHYVLEACAENGKECIVLDRPNPNDYIQGPVLDMKFKSFVGMHPIPILHGLTIGELAQMINGEGWLKNKVKCNLQVISMTGWKHGQTYSLPVKPSPNLPNDQAISLYPSLCFFEATGISVGRGTDFPFQVAGAPSTKYGDFTFIPRSIAGAKTPLHLNKVCYGEDLRQNAIEGGIDLSYLLSFYKKSNQGSAFFINPKFMDLLAGTDKLRLQIIAGISAQNIYETWNEDLVKYKTMRNKYLLYPEKDG